MKKYLKLKPECGTWMCPIYKIQSNQMRLARQRSYFLSYKPQPKPQHQPQDNLKVSWDINTYKERLHTTPVLTVDNAHVDDPACFSTK